MTLGLWVARIGLALSLAAAVGLFVLSNSKMVRIAALSHSEACQLALQSNLSPDARIAIIGSSRSRDAINPINLAQLLGLPVDVAVNLGHPAIGPAYDLGTVSAITRDHDFEVVLVEVLPRSDALQEAELRLDPSPDPIAARLSVGAVRHSFVTGLSTGDQIKLLMREAPSFALGVSDVMTVTAQRMTTTIALLRTKEIYPKLWRDHPMIDVNRAGLCALQVNSADATPDTDREQRRQSSITGYQEFFEAGAWQDPDALGFLTQDSSAIDRATLQALSERADARGFKLAFFYVPGVHVPVNVALASEFEEAFGRPLLIAPPELRRDMDGNGFYDNAHLNADGSRIFVDWLAGEVEALLSGTNP